MSSQYAALYSSSSPHSSGNNVPLLPVDSNGRVVNNSEGDHASAGLGTPLLKDKYGKPLILHGASLLACTAAMANTILGAGMLGLPHAMAESGYLLGVFLLLAAATCSAFALHLLSVSSMKVGTEPSSFFVVASHAVPKATFLIDLAVAIKCFGVGTSFLIVIGDLIPEAVGSLAGQGHAGILYDRRLWIAIYVFAIVLPLSCLRSLNALRFTATISMFFVSFLVGVITLYAFVPSLDECAGWHVQSDVDQSQCQAGTTLIKFDMGTLKVFSIFIFGFTCHQNIFSACNELSNLTVPRINRVIFGCIGTALTAYLLIALCAYHTYGTMIQSNVLINYPDNTVLAIARILIATNCAFTYPLQCNPCRNSISLLMHQWQYRNEGDKALIPVHAPSEIRLTVLTAMITMGSLGVAMVVKDLGVILAIVGATGSTTISYILPGLIYLKLTADEEWNFKKYAAAALLTAGCIIIPSCLTFIFLGAGGE